MDRSSTVADGLRRYLSAEHADVTIESIRRPNDGLSSETYLVRVGGLGGNGTGRDLVVRVAPTVGLFPVYDLALQARIQGSVPVPTAPVIACESDPSWLGSPFMLMEHVAGHVLSDNPHFSTEGWLFSSPAPLQARVYAAFVDVLADIHRSPRVDGLPTLDVASWSDYLAWATDGAPPPALVDALAWCRAHEPTLSGPPSMLWGDVRLGNVIFTSSGDVAAVLDWEMAAVGAPEHDLGWFFALRPRRGESPELPGFLSRDETLARYCARLGRDVGDLAFYETFALLRSTAILIRTQRLLIENGETDHWLVGFDPIPRRLLRLS